jgi:hypothetical protein
MFKHEDWLRITSMAQIGTGILNLLLFYGNLTRVKTILLLLTKLSISKIIEILLKNCHCRCGHMFCKIFAKNQLKNPKSHQNLPKLIATNNLDRKNIEEN